MKTTQEQLEALSRETSLSLAAGAWPDFLRTVAWTHKYTFPDQLLIFAQKPDATTCEPYKVWNSDRFQRIPRKGTAIALPNPTEGSSGIRYVFDASDTFVRRGATNPEPPVWRITPEDEPIVRRTLARQYLPHEQQSETHLICAPADFYRSVAFQVVLNHSKTFQQQLEQIQHTCELNRYPQIETERILITLLTESLSAVLQHRCGLEPVVRNDFLSHVKHFDSEEAIAMLGGATQLLAQETLSALNQDIQRAEDKGAEKTPQGRGEPSYASNPHSLPQTPKLPSERKQIPSEDIKATAPLSIPEEDLDRFLMAGPPLDGGKFRLYAAAIDPQITPKQLTDLLRKEYGTGERMYMRLDGTFESLSWSPSGLAQALASPQDISPLTSTWEAVTAQLNSLVEKKSYLTPEEAGHIADHYANQRAMQGRQRAGAAIVSLLRIFEENRSELVHWAEQVRAYAHENNECARQALSGKLLALRIQPKLRSDETSLAILNELQCILAERSEGECTLSKDLSNVNFSPQKGTVSAHSKKTTSTDSVTPCKGAYIYSEKSASISSDNCSAASVKRNALTSFLPNNENYGYGAYPIHALRTAISSLLKSQYPVYCTQSLETSENSAHVADKLAMIFSDFTAESARLAASPSSAHEETVLRTPDYNGSILAALAFRMRQSNDPKVSLSGREALHMMEAMYRTNEATLHQFADASDWLLNQNPSSVLTFGPMDAVHLEGRTYEVQRVLGDEIHLVVSKTGESLPPIGAEELSRRIRSRACNRLFPAWSRNLDAPICQREDQKLLSELLRHFGTWCASESIRIPGAYYEAVRTHLLNTRVSEDLAANGKAILQAATAIRQFFPQSDPLPERGRETARLLGRAGDWLELPSQTNSHGDPLLDHPELLRTDQSRLARRDKVALTDLLHHFATYRWTFTNKTPTLCIHDAERREAEFSLLDTVRVSDSVEDNRNNLRMAKTILTRWFLPFESIQPEVLERQEVLLAAAEQVILDPPYREESSTHTHTYTHTHTSSESLVPEAIEDVEEDTLFHHQHSPETSAVSSNGPHQNQSSPPLNHRIQDAQKRIAQSKLESRTSTKTPVLM